MQGAYIMTHPDAYDSAFWKSLPNGTFWPGQLVCQCIRLALILSCLSACSCHGRTFALIIFWLHARC